jgi:hypothetical protein
MPLEDVDGGFRVYKLATSNIRAWEPDSDNLATTLEETVDHLKSDRTEQDVLYELLLKLGLDLCVPIETKTLAGKAVHSIGGGVLIACLTEKIAREDVEKLGLGLSSGTRRWRRQGIRRACSATAPSPTTSPRPTSPLPLSRTVSPPYAAYRDRAHETPF